MNAAEKKFEALNLAVVLMRKIFHRMRRAIEAGEISELRTRLNKQEIIDICQWKYDWQTLLKKLIDKYGLVYLPTGPKHKAYTFKANILSEIADGTTHLLPDEADEFLLRLIMESSTGTPQTRKCLSGVSDSVALVAARDYEDAKEYLKSLGEYANNVYKAQALAPEMPYVDDKYDYGQGDPFAREGDIEEDENREPTEKELQAILGELW